MRPFHLAMPVNNLNACRTFYKETMGFCEGRSSDHWVDFNFYGHQFVIHLVESNKGFSKDALNNVDGHQVPVPHFGVVLSMEEWESLADRLQGKVEFVIEPYIRFKGEVGEQATMFFLDPSGNALEFKAFKNLTNLFEK